jgi:hypothetical protein
MDDKMLREKLRAYICKELIRRRQLSLTDTEGIITGGLMDSSHWPSLRCTSRRNSACTFLMPI